ncbi:ParA family protein [gamma proteobacterium HTCC5015]|nr:ParA family protein [gamma proteobacterium HTCC5015]
MIRVVFNQKGGVGKSSITANLAAVAAHSGKRTLVVDLDPQCNSSQYLLSDFFDGQEHDQSIARFFSDSLKFKLMDKDPQEYVYKTDYDNLDVLPADEELYDLQVKLEAKHKIYKLRDGLNKLRERYDEIYVDTPPAFNFFTLSALIGADSVLIPFDCDDFSRRALFNLLDNVEETRQDHNASLRLEGIVVNQFLPQARLPKKVVQDLIDEGLPVFETKLSSSVKMRESHDEAKPLIYLAPKHKLTQQFVELYKELQTA